MLDGELIPRAFYLRPVAEVARDLLGQILWREGVALRITEVEAYGGPEDSASHCRHGRTPRNAPMWQEGGCAYVFRCYGIHHLLNVVTGPEGQGSAILIRSAEVLAGQDYVRERRRGSLDCRGPGKVGEALGLDLNFNGHCLDEPGGLELRIGTPVSTILMGPRVGIDYARPEDRMAPLRFAVANPALVSRPHLSHIR